MKTPEPGTRRAALVMTTLAAGNALAWVWILRIVASVLGVEPGPGSYAALAGVTGLAVPVAVAAARLD